MIPSTIPQKAIVGLHDTSTSTLNAFRFVAPHEAKVSAFDRSFHFGDSLYEVTRSYEGILFSLVEHLKRLQHSAELAYYETALDLDQIQQLVIATCQAYFRQFGNHDVYVRVTVSRGTGDLSIDRSTASNPYALVFVKELERYPDQYYQKGVHYAIVERRRNLPQALDPAMKSGNYLNNILALCEAKKMGASDAMILNYQGFVTEGTTNNVYIVKNQTIYTSPLSVGILAGITRDWIFELCRTHNIKIEERLFTAQDVFNADEVFLSSSTKEVMAITTISNQPIQTGKPGPITLKLGQLMKKLIADYCQKNRDQSLYV